MEAARASPAMTISFISSLSLAFGGESETYYTLPGAFLLSSLPLIPYPVSGWASSISAQGLCCAHPPPFDGDPS